MGAASLRAGWAGSWVGQLGCPSVPSLEQCWWWSGSANTPSFQMSPQWWSRFQLKPESQSAAQGLDHARYQAQLWQECKHTCGARACLFLLPCTGASHCYPAGDGKVEMHYSPSKTLLSQTVWCHTYSLCLFEMVFNAGTFFCQCRVAEIHLWIHSSVLKIIFKLANCSFFFLSSLVWGFFEHY